MKRAKCLDPPGFRCYYTGRLLELYDTKSPYYASFDHRTPGNEGDLVMCVRWINSMKGAMTEDEFWAEVLAPDDHHFNGKPFPIELTRLKYWRGNAPARSMSPARLPLNDSDPQSPLYMEFDHPVPGKKGRLKAVVAFVNRMKTDLSEREFWAQIHELARFRREGVTFRDVIKFRHWFRMARP